MKITETLFIAWLLTGIAVSNAFSQVTNSGLIASNSNEYVEEKRELKQGYYLVIGVFSNFQNLERYNSELTKKGHPVNYVFSKSKNRYYSYLYYSDSFNQADEKFREIKKNNGLWEVWVLKVDNNQESNIRIDENSNPQNTENQNSASQPTSEVSIETKKHHHHHHGHKHHQRDLSVTHNSYNLYVNVHNGMHEEIPTNIQVINGEHAHLLTTIHSHENTALNCPKSKKQQVQLVCEVFGFHKTTFDLKLDNPVTPSTMYNVKVEDNKILVDLPLEKYRKGDIMTMYNVFFHANTNVMRMISNYELQKLLQMLNENPHLRIKIHGHTNGNSFGTITKITGDCENFFNPTDLIGTKGTSKKLSLLRASAIQQYLIKNGIAEDRIEVKGWGGKRMIHKENSPKYEYNVRVEIEILQD